MPKTQIELPKIKQTTTVTAAMRLIKSVEQSRKTQLNSSLLALLPINICQGLLSHD